MVREISKSGTDCLDIETLKQWLLAHVLDLDRDLARFIQNPAPST
jgi:hemerythrin